MFLKRGLPSGERRVGFRVAVFWERLKAMRMVFSGLPGR